MMRKLETNMPRLTGNLQQRALKMTRKPQMILSMLMSKRREERNPKERKKLPLRNSPPRKTVMPRRRGQPRNRKHVMSLFVLRFLTQLNPLERGY